MKAKFKFMCALVVCVSGLPIAAPAAEQNPLQSLVNALGKLAPANTNTNQAGPQSAEGSSSTNKFSGEDAEILRLLQVQGDDFLKDGVGLLCRGNDFNAEWLKQENKDIQMALDKGDYGAARVTSDVGASYIAGCAFSRYKSSSEPLYFMDQSFLNYSLANWAEMVGTKMVLGRKYAKADAVVYVLFMDRWNRKP